MIIITCFFTFMVFLQTEALPHYTKNEHDNSDAHTSNERWPKYIAGRIKDAVWATYCFVFRRLKESVKKLVNHGASLADISFIHLATYFQLQAHYNSFAVQSKRLRQGCFLHSQGCFLHFYRGTRSKPTTFHKKVDLLLTCEDQRSLNVRGKPAHHYMLYYFFFLVEKEDESRK